MLNKLNIPKPLVEKEKMIDWIVVFEAMTERNKIDQEAWESLPWQGQLAMYNGKLLCIAENFSKNANSECK